MINFSNQAVFNLKPIQEKDVNQEAFNLFIEGEKVLQAYKTVRDQVIFTNKRILAIDIQGITGKRKDYSTLPYSRIQYFSVQTPGFAEFIPDCEMEIYFTNGFTAKFEFKGQCNIIELGRIISQYALNNE